MARSSAPVPPKHVACQAGLEEYRKEQNGDYDYEEHLLLVTSHDPNNCYTCHELSLVREVGHDPEQCVHCAQESGYYAAFDDDYDDYYDVFVDEPERFPDHELLDHLGYSGPIVDELDYWACLDDPFGQPRPYGLQDFADQL